MKASVFRYERAGTVAEATALLARHGEGARIIAGGQSLIPTMAVRMAAPDILVDIGGIAPLRGIEMVEDGGRRRIRIGALVRHAEIERSAVIAAEVPLLAQAVRHVAHQAIRNRGTFGGSLAAADPASEFPACALALEATIHVEGPDGARAIAAEEFFLGPYETALRPSEILTTVDIDAQVPGVRVGFAELARRQGDYALVGLALVGTLQDEARGGACPAFATIRPVFLSVGSTPVPARGAARVLTDPGVADSDRLAQAQDALAGDLDPPSDPQASAALRLHLARTLLARVIRQILESTDVA